MQNVDQKKIEGSKTTRFTIGDSEKAKGNGVFYLPYSILSNGHIVIDIKKREGISDCKKDLMIVGIEIPNKKIQIAKNNYTPNWEFIDEKDNIFGFDVHFTKVGNALLMSKNKPNFVSAINILVEKISA